MKFEQFALPNSCHQFLLTKSFHLSIQIAKREEPLPKPSPEDVQIANEYAPKNNCTIFLGYTSNMASCGVRETIRFLVQHKMVDCIGKVIGI